MKKKKTISIGKVFFNVPVALILIIIALLVLVPLHQQRGNEEYSRTSKGNAGWYPV